MDNRRHDTWPPEGRQAQPPGIRMNRDRLEGGWKQFCGTVKEQWGRLADDPQCESAGRRERLAGRVQERYGISTEESARQLKEFLDRNRNRNLSKS